jgi:hypothetical protein
MRVMVTPVAGSNLLTFYQGQAALTLLTGSSTSTTANGASTTSSTNSSTLLSYLQQKEGISSSTSSSSTVKAPTAPWNSATGTATGTPTVSKAVQNAISGAPFVDPGSAKLDAPGGVSTSDYQNLFALYQGLNTLNDLATTAAGSSSTSSSLSNITSAQLQSAFNSGIQQVQNFLSNAPFSEFNLVAGKVNTSEQSTVGIPNGTYQSYTTGVIGTGQEESPLKALQGNVQFTISVASKFATTSIKKADGTTQTFTTPPTQINIDLSNMGSKPRTIDNVVNYINQQLSAAGVSTKFAVANLGDAPVTTTTNGKTTTTATGDPQWGFTINGGSSEIVSFSAPSTSTGLYVGMGTGGATTYATSSTSNSSSSTSNTTTTPTGEQILKLQTADNVTGTAPTLTTSAANSALPVGGVFAKNLPDGVTSIQASATGSDGSVYMLANASGTLNGAPVPGTQGVALLKYDSAGKLLYSKVLAGEQDATGFSLAVDSSGDVAVAGTNTVPATVSSSGLTTAAASTSAFVQVFDSTGAPSWSQTVPATGGISAASGVAFSPDGSTVYLSGATTGSVGNQTPKGSSDEFIQGFMNTVTKAQANAGDKLGTPTFTTQYGATGGANTSSGMVVDPTTGTLYTAGIENGKAVVRSFSPNGTKAPTALATRSLGSADSLVGIGLSNGQIVVGGNVSHATINAATVAKPFAGVEDGFVASISTNLAAQPSDTVTYLGQSGVTLTATDMTIAGGQAYLTGTEANDPNSLAAANATEGFVTGVNLATGAVSSTTRLAGANGQATPTTIVAAGSGASVLDQLGLPTGTLNAATSGLIVGATPINAGDSFYVRTSPGGAQTQITISASDTLTTLTNKINNALGASGKATVVTVGSNSELSITPTDTSSFIELDSQAAANTVPYTQQNSGSGTDVLSALGLSSGVIRTVKTINGLTDVKQLREYGLDLPSNLNLTTAANAQHASNAIQAAMVQIKTAYQDLVTPPTMASEQAAQASSSGGSVPTYLTNEIANYQAGLSRLLANQSSSSSASTGLASLFG